MQLRNLMCPNCGGTLDISLDDKEYIFCPYCGKKFFVEDGKKEYTINQNINIKKDININSKTEHTRHNINEADVIRAKTEDREKRNAWKYILGYLAVMAFLFGSMFFLAGREERVAKRALKEAIDSGKISAGSYEDYEGEHYEAVVAQLEALGFENISCVDLDDSGVLFWQAEKVESVSIGGETTFYKSDYFLPATSVIIKYH